MTEDELHAHQDAELEKKYILDRVNLGFSRLTSLELADLLATDQGQRTAAELGAPLSEDEERQAGEWMGLAASYGQIRDAVHAAAGSNYAGEWLEKEDRGRVRIYVSGGSGQTVGQIQEVFDAAGLSDRFETVQVRYSDAELQSVVDEIQSQMEAGSDVADRIAMFEIDPRRNLVVVQPNTATGSTEILVSAFNHDERIAVGDPIEISQHSAAVGGDGLGVFNGLYCSQGVSARTNIPNIGWIHHWVTAGHCGSNTWFHWSNYNSGGHNPSGQTVSIYYPNNSPGDSQAINIPPSETSTLVRTDTYGVYGLRYLTTIDDGIWQVGGTPFQCHSGFATRINTGSWISCGSVENPSVSYTASGHNYTQSRRYSCSYSTGGDSGGTTFGMYFGSYDASLLGFHSAGNSVQCFSTRAGTQIAGLGIGQYVLQ